MVEMLETATILRRATARSLVVLDEVGRGTSTYDGMSLAWAVVEELHREGSARPRALFATHYHELTRLAEHLPRVVNRSILVEEEGDEVAFLHQVVDGPADRSYGIHVARLAGLPERVLARARAILALLEATAPDPLAGASLVADAPRASSGAAAKTGAAQDASRKSAPAGDPLPLFAAAEPGAQLAEKLAALELDGLAPKDALALLYEWQQLVRGAAARP
jgi:DNA mismatch repair protein MutS